MSWSGGGLILKVSAGVPPLAPCAAPSLEVPAWLWEWAPQLAPKCASCMGVAEQEGFPEVTSCSLTEAGILPKLWNGEKQACEPVLTS